LRRRLEKLKEGAHVLVMSKNRPNRQKDRHRLAVSFRQRTWAQFMWDIIPISGIQRFQIDAQVGFVSYFHFKV